VERNWDHVFPESWYPQTTPSNLEKWKIPSCIRCNSALGMMEDRLLIQLAHALDPDHLAAPEYTTRGSARSLLRQERTNVIKELAPPSERAF